MQKLYLGLLFVFIFWLGASDVQAIVDPLSTPNNRVGVHILDTSEVEQAARLVNSTGGKWGYVTIPMRSNDRDREKWVKFFEDCRKLQIIPIIRLATYPDAEAGGWAVPTVYDLVDFANFLNEMPWPVKNRYIILFNEINHAQEWGGQVSPLEYATILIDAQKVFKARSDDFFLISAGLDMSVPNSKTSMDALEYLRQISRLQPEWYQSLDGFSAHAYPNPAFSSSAYSTTRYGISSYKHELDLLARLGYEPKPLFITETGWVNDTGQYTQAFTEVWTDPNLVAITPFLLYSAGGPFQGFSLLDPNLAPKPKYRQILELAKISGSPLLSNVSFVPQSTITAANPIQALGGNVFRSFSNLWKRVAGQKSLKVGSAELWVELADTPAETEQGLSNRKELAQDAGLLFIFAKPAKYRFWMKDMHFALDIIWIRDGKIVRIDKDVLPPDQTGGTPVILDPEQEVTEVLEVNTGWVDKYGITVGEEIHLN